MTNKPTSLDELGQRLVDVYGENVASILHEQAAEELLNADKVVLIFFDDPTTPYSYEGPYTFDEAMQGAAEGMAEAKRDMPNDPPPGFRIEVLRDIRGERP